MTIVERRKLIWFTEHKIQGRAIEYSSCSFNQNKSDNTNELKEKKNKISLFTSHSFIERLFPESSLRYVISFLMSSL